MDMETEDKGPSSLFRSPFGSDKPIAPYASPEKKPVLAYTAIRKNSEFITFNLDFTDDENGTVIKVSPKPELTLAGALVFIVFAIFCSAVFFRDLSPLEGKISLMHLVLLCAALFVLYLVINYFIAWKHLDKVFVEIFNCEKLNSLTMEFQNRKSTDNEFPDSAQLVLSVFFAALLTAYLIYMTRQYAESIVKYKDDPEVHEEGLWFVGTFIIVLILSVLSFAFAVSSAKKADSSFKWISGLVLSAYTVLCVFAYIMIIKYLPAWM